MKKIILASTSPRRRELLEQIGLDFEVVPSRYEEDMTLELSPFELAKTLSKGKAKEVASKHKNAVVIGADTFLVFQNKLLGKPKDMKDAKKMLSSLSGKTHSVITGFTIIDTDSKKIISKVVEAKVFFRKISSAEIEKYIRKDNPLDKAGAYNLLGGAGIFIEKLEGDFFTIIGLPLCALSKELKKFNFSQK